jgi:hypothetical protein
MLSVDQRRDICCKFALWKDWLCIHPFIFAALPVVLLLTFAKSELLPEEVVPALVALEVIVSLFFVFAAVVWRSVHKGAIAASFFIIWLFVYRVWQITLETYWSFISTQPWIPVVTFFGFFAFILVVFLKGQWQFGGRKVSLDFERMNFVMNFVSTLLMIFNVVPLIAYEISQQQEFAYQRQQLQRNIAGLHLEENIERPDVYYIILDGFAPPITLKEFWHFDDPGFTNFLTSKGFYVVPRALSNFDRTEFSLCSSLNMDYINPVVDRHKASHSGDISGVVLMRLIQDSSVVRLFKQLGYRIVTVSSGSFGTDSVLTADRVIRVNSVNHFFRAIAHCTPWWSLETYFPLLRDYYGDTRLAAGSRMKDILAEKSPKFVFIHTDLPHAPYLFDENGNRQKLPPSLLPDWEPPSGYFSQWKFCVKQVEQWVDVILKASNGKAVIIVQSDHGSGLRMKDPLDWYCERMRILNAYYLPSDSSAGKKNGNCSLYPTITPVNSFRVVFNKYFKVGLPLLKDESYCSPVWEKPFEWQEVTNKVRFEVDQSRKVTE